MPIFGNLGAIIKTRDNFAKPNENPMMEVGKYYFGDDQPGVFGFCFQKYPTLVISDPAILEELYVNKNKYFDKHPRIYEVMKPMMGESILLARSNELWSRKRKSLSTAFYKDKLSKMMDIIRNVVTNYVKALEKEFIIPEKPFNLA